MTMRIAAVGFFWRFRFLVLSYLRVRLCTPTCNNFLTGRPIVETIRPVPLSS
jgi:hypothetical protein